MENGTVLIIPRMAFEQAGQYGCEANGGVEAINVTTNILFRGRQLKCI